MKIETPFDNWKASCSQFGYLLTNLPEEFTEEDGKKLTAAREEKASGINENGNKVKWSETKQAVLDKLLVKKDGIDTLPDGAITKLEEIFNHVFWKRKKLLQNKYLEKGIMNEEDSLELISDVLGETFWKNDELIENDHAKGTPDSVTSKVIDAKSNYDYFTFKAAELIALYIWQIRCYIWILLCMGRKIDRTGELIYALVNTAAHRIEAERKSMWFAMGQPDQEEERYIKAASQLEQNHIPDIEKFKEEFPNFDLVNSVWRDIPKHMRIKRFPVTLEDSHIEHMTRRSIMCKKWLINRYFEELEVINSVEIK